MFGLMKKRKENFPVLTETSLARIRKVATSPPPISGGIALKRDMEEWNYSKYMYTHLKEYYKKIDEERERKRVEIELARQREIQIAVAAARRQQEQERLAIEAKRKKEIKESFQEMEEIVREIRNTN